MNSHTKFTVFNFIMAWNISKKYNVWCCSVTSSASPPYTAILWQKGLFGWFCLFCVFILWFSHHNVTICASSGHIRCLIDVFYSTFWKFLMRCLFYFNMKTYVFVLSTENLNPISMTTLLLSWWHSAVSIQCIPNFFPSFKLLYYPQKVRPPFLCSHRYIYGK